MQEYAWPAGDARSKPQHTALCVTTAVAGTHLVLSQCFNHLPQYIAGVLANPVRVQLFKHLLQISYKGLWIWAGVLFTQIQHGTSQLSAILLCQSLHNRHRNRQMSRSVPVNQCLQVDKKTACKTRKCPPPRRAKTVHNMCGGENGNHHSNGASTTMCRTKHLEEVDHIVLVILAELCNHASVQQYQLW